MSSSSAKQNPFLHPVWRGVLAFVAVVAISGALLCWIAPRKRLQFAPQCPRTSADAGADTVVAQLCVAEVDGDSSTLVIALVAVSVFLIVLAANGRRISTLKIPGAGEAGFEDSQKKAKEALKGKGAELDPTADEKDEAIEAVQPVAAATDTITLEGKDLDIFALQDVPARVIADLLSHLRNESVLPPNLDTEFVARRTGRGKNPWFIKFKDLPRTYRISYGGQAKDVATVKTID